MSVIRLRPLLLALALLLPASSAMAGDEGGFLHSLGQFVLDGLGPPRTMEDIQREERQAAAARLAAEADSRRAEEAGSAAPSPVMVAVAAQKPESDAVAAPVQVARVDAVVFPPEVSAGTESASPALSSETAVAAPPPTTADRADPSEEPRVVAVPPPPRPRPVAVETRVAQVAPVLPAEPLKSTIAATATVDQAVRLGGASGLYTRRLSGQ